MGTKVYLAGKIGKNDWRHDIVKGLRAAFDCTGLDDVSGCGGAPSTRKKWPILKAAIFGEWDYVGPYFESCDHGCAHASGTHGWMPSEIGTPKHGLSFVADDCMQAVEQADVIFAWIDSLDAHGTYAELGAGRALGKLCFAASPEYLPDLWFVYALTHNIVLGKSPSDALMDTMESWRWFFYGDEILESPIEKSFFVIGVEILPHLRPQYRVGPYRADFALPEHKTLIELDGHDYHKTKEQRTSDAKRDRYLEKEGWRVIRFTGSEVWRDPVACAYSVRDIIIANGGEI